MAIKTGTNGTKGRWVLIAALAGVALFGSYSFAQAKGASSSGAGGDILSSAAASVSSAAGGGCGGACCGGGAQAPESAKVPKAAEIVGDVQKISVDVSKGYYDPSTIELKAGVPAEITFSQGSGCTAQVQSAELGFSEDLSGGAKTVKIPALTAGTYSFACGMNMVFGSIVVK